jgi:hypothetical protein
MVDDYHRLRQLDGVLMGRLRTLLGRHTLGGDERVFGRAKAVARLVRDLKNVRRRVGHIEGDINYARKRVARIEG